MVFTTELYFKEVHTRAHLATQSLIKSVRRGLCIIEMSYFEAVEQL